MNVSPTLCKRPTYHDLPPDLKELYKKRVEDAIRGLQEKIGPNAKVSNASRKNFQQRIFEEIAIESGMIKKEAVGKKDMEKIPKAEKIIAAAERVLVHDKEEIVKKTETTPVKTKRKGKEKVKEKTILYSPETFSQETLTEQIKQLFNKLETAEFFPGMEKNEFYPLLSTWKTNIGKLLEDLTETQKMKNLLVILNGIIGSLELEKQKEQYEPEFSRLLHTMWEKQAIIEKVFKEKQDGDWKTHLNELQKIREASVPKPLSENCQKTLDRISKPTSCKTREEAERANQAVLDIKETMRIRDINYRYSYLCYHLMKMTMIKLAKRLNDTKDYLNNYPNINRFKANKIPFKESSKHLLSEREDNNKERVIDHLIDINGQVLTAKEILDSLLDTLTESMSSTYHADYLPILSDLRTLLTQNVIHLRNEIKEAKQEAENAKKRLELVINQEKIWALNHEDEENLASMAQNNPDCNPIPESIRKHKQRKAAAETQIQILNALTKNTESRMTKEEGFVGSYFVKISAGVEPLFDKYCTKVSELEVKAEAGK